MMMQQLWKRMYRYKMVYLMLLPVLAYFIVFSVYPLVLGIRNSFMSSRMIGDSEFIGIQNYIDVFNNPVYTQAFSNTVIVGAGTFIVQFLFGLFLALGINEIRNKAGKSMIQSITYLPYMLSWSIVGGLWIKILAPTGMLNGLLNLFNSSRTMVAFMAEPKYARMIMILTGAWKSAGYYTLLFLAAIVSIDQSIYEAAAIDGASRVNQMRSITVPNLVPTMKVIVVLGTMGLLRNFDQIFIMRNSVIDDKIRNLLYLIYNDGIQKFNTGMATAAAALVLIATFVISYIVRKVIKYDQNY